MTNQNNLNFMIDSDKHAYCILAHGNWKQLQLLVSVLDDERNDIFLHIDKKALSSFEIWGGKVKTNHSHIFMANSIDVRWSDISLADAEMSLFKKVVAVENCYDRVHLISGVDFPLKSQNAIHEFFQNRKEEFIDVRHPKEFEKRLRYYHLLVKYRRNRPIVDFTRRLLLLPQLPFVNRLKTAPLKYAYGSEWCSLTYAAVKEIVEKYPTCRYMFKYSTCPDEHYKQMILQANPKFSFAKEGCMRYFVFSPVNPSPKTLTMEDYENVMKSGCLFARKFDFKVDKEVINKIINKIS